MNAPQPGRTEQPIRPLGVEPQRPAGPLIAWAVVYLAWLAVLVWLALFKTIRL